MYFVEICEQLEITFITLKSHLNTLKKYREKYFRKPIIVILIERNYAFDSSQLRRGLKSSGII